MLSTHMSKLNYTLGTFSGTCPRRFSFRGFLSKEFHAKWGKFGSKSGSGGFPKRTKINGRKKTALQSPVS